MEAEGEAVADAIEARLRTGRPMGGAEWIAEMEDRQGRPLAPKRRGPKPTVDGGVWYTVPEIHVPEIHVRQLIFSGLCGQ